MEGENNDSNKLVDVSEPLLNELEAPNINISIKEGNTSFFQTCFNGLNSITGTPPFFTFHHSITKYYVNRAESKFGSVCLGYDSTREFIFKS